MPEIVRFPLILGQIDPSAAIDPDAFPPQQSPLLLESLPDREGDRSPAVDDPVPG